MACYMVGGFPFSDICPVCTHYNISGGILITTDFTVPYNICIHKFLSIVRMISEGSCYTEDLQSNDAKNSAFKL